VASSTLTVMADKRLSWIDKTVDCTRGESALDLSTHTLLYRQQSYSVCIKIRETEVVLLDLCILRI
jgi:hypothetical protein